MGFVLPDERPVPAVTTPQMREIDRAMIEDFHVELLQMMENAGRNLADLAGALYSPRTIMVLAGPGGNGGGGLAAAGLANPNAAWHYPLRARWPERSRTT